MLLERRVGRSIGHGALYAARWLEDIEDVKGEDMHLLKNIALEGHVEIPISKMKFKVGQLIRRRADSKDVLEINGKELELTPGSTPEQKNAVRFKVLDVKPGWYLLRATWLKRRGADWEPAKWVDENCELHPRSPKK